MIIFWLICALLVIVALAFILPPLMQGANDPLEAGREEANIAVYRDQIAELEADLRNGIISDEQCGQERDEIERRLLEDVSDSQAAQTKAQPAAKPNKQPTGDRAAVYAVAFGVPLIAVALYLQLGSRNSITPPAITSKPQSAATLQGNEQANEQRRIETNVAGLAKRLEQNPDDVKGWIMLANSFNSLERYADASAAYAKATALKTDDADLWADYAFALAMTNGRQLKGQPSELLEKALKLDPENPKALQLSGTAAFEAKNYQQAIAYWQKLLPKAGPDSELGQALAQRIAEAKTLAGKK